MRGFLFASIAGFAVAGCAPVPGLVICTAEFVYGVNITVVNENGDPVSGATLTLTDGSFTETMVEAQPGTYMGAGERAGVYTLTVEAGGFEPRTIDNIVVLSTVCHVIPVTRTVTLTASEDATTARPARRVEAVTERGR